MTSDKGPSLVVGYGRKMLNWNVYTASRKMRNMNKRTGPTGNLQRDETKLNLVQPYQSPEEKPPGGTRTRLGGSTLGGRAAGSGCTGLACFGSGAGSCGVLWPFWPFWLGVSVACPFDGFGSSWAEKLEQILWIGSRLNKANAKSYLLR